MLNTKKSFYLLIGLISLSAKAQDSLNLYKAINNQYNVERSLKAQYYYNPASMSGYSSQSFSEFKTGYHNRNEKVYREQLGKGDKGLTIEANSFQRLSPTRYVWGSATYQNLKKGSIKWNENLDYDRIAPYISSDSLGGKMNVERYEFSGGYLQKIKKWTIAGQMSYTAKLGHRSRDPRTQNTTSDLKIISGINYRIFREYEVGLFGEFNKYIQKNSITFQSIMGKPFVYQMTGLGFSNYIFNGSSNPNSSYEEFKLKGGLQISNRQGRDFYFQVSFGNSNNVKAYSADPPYDMSELKNNTFELEGAKFLDLNEKHRIGLLASYKGSIKNGHEYGYSLNTTSLTQIFKRKSYRKDDYNTLIKGLYQYNQDHFSISFTPFYGYQEIKEKRLNPDSGQKFVYSYFGLNADYKQRINENQVVTFQPYFSKRIVNKSINALAPVGNTGIDKWMLEDYLFQASNIDTFGITARYDFKLEKLPAFFVSAEFQSQKIQHKNNQYINASIGITF